MSWISAFLAMALALGCSLPRTRDCFPKRSARTIATEEAPAVASPPAALAETVALEVVATGLVQPIALAQPPGDSERLFVAERGGRIVILRPGARPVVFADLSDRVATEDREQGLLGIAFHPEHTVEERLYVNYTGRDDGATYVVEFRVAKGDPDKLDLSSGRQLLRIGQPFRNHNGGHLAFAGDGNLYVGMGDGGGRGDPRGHAQRCSSWRGKMLKVSVDSAQPTVEVVQLGLRNPWRYSFDRKTGDLYIGDVGVDSWEWIYAVDRTGFVGHNFGWNITAGSRCAGSRPCDRSGLTGPLLEYEHGDGCAVIGGYVYRGRALPRLRGMYFFSDFCSGFVRSFVRRGREVRDYWDWKNALDPQSRLRRVVSFAEDQGGELYLLSLEGTVFKLVPRVGSVDTRGTDDGESPGDGDTRPSGVDPE